MTKKIFVQCHGNKQKDRSFVINFMQRRSFIFGVQGYLKLGVLLEGLRRLMSYKVALHVLVTFTGLVVPIHKHITVLYSDFPQCQEQKLSQ